MRITIATLYLPYPHVPHGGGQDLFHMIRFMSQRHAVSVVSFVDATQAVHAETLRPFVDDLRLVWPAVSWQQKWRQGLTSLRQGQWRSLGRRADTQMHQIISQWPTDVLHCAWTEMGRYLTAAAPHVIRVLDEVDVRFVVDEVAGTSRIQTVRRKQQELTYCQTADFVLTRSVRDQTVLQQAVPGLDSLVIPPVGLRTALTAVSPKTSIPGRVLFVGNMSRHRNQTAVSWFTQAIWPHIRDACPTATLHIVGAEPPADIMAVSQQPGVTVTGWVPDLTVEYAQARVIVAPMRSEAGALNKLLDGLAAARPVVATTIANAGTAAPPTAVRLADTAAAFAFAVIHLLQDDDAWQQQGTAGRQFVKSQVDWHAAVTHYEQVLSTAVRERTAHA